MRRPYLVASLFQSSFLVAIFPIRSSWASTAGPVYSICQGMLTAVSADVSRIASCAHIQGAVDMSHMTLPELLVPNVEQIQLDMAQAGSQELLPALRLAHNLVTTSIRFPDLRRVVGDVLVFDNTAMQLLSMPSLEEMQGGFLVTANQLVPSSAPSSNAPSQAFEVDLRSLRTVVGNLSLLNVHTLALDKLTRIDGDLSLVKTELRTLQLESLQKMEGSGTISLRANRQLTTIQFDQLESIHGSLYLADNPKWIGFRGTDMPNLRRIQGSLVVDQMEQPGFLRFFDLGSQLQAIDGALTLRLKVAEGDGGVAMKQQNVSLPQYPQIACKQLQTQFKDSGIVRGVFSCKIFDKNGKEVDSSESAAIVLAPSQMMTFAILGGLLAYWWAL